MPYEVKYTAESPNSVEIDGIGVVTNDTTLIVDDETHEAFRNRNAISVTKVNKAGKMTATYELGPTLLQAFKDHPYIEVSEVKDGGK